MMKNAFRREKRLQFPSDIIIDSPSMKLERDSVLKIHKYEQDL